MPVTAEDYLRKIQVNFTGSVLFAVILLIFFIFSGFELNILSVTTSDPIFWILLFVRIVPGQYLLQMYYRQIVAQGRKSRIDLDMPYAISYMQALSTTMPPYEMIRKIHEEHDMFGEISKEFGMIVRDVELFGDDLIAAMKNLQRMTPSPHLRDFLNDLAIVFDSGGNVTTYFGAKTEYYRDQAKQELEMVLKTIEIMAEVYVTAFVAGPIALIIMIVAQGMTNNSQMEWILPMMYIGYSGRCDRPDLDPLHDASPGEPRDFSAVRPSNMISRDLSRSILLKRHPDQMMKMQSSTNGWQQTSGITIFSACCATRCGHTFRSTDYGLAAGILVVGIMSCSGSSGASIPFSRKYIRSRHMPDDHRIHGTDCPCIRGAAVVRAEHRIPSPGILTGTFRYERYRDHPARGNPADLECKTGGAEFGTFPCLTGYRVGAYVKSALVRMEERIGLVSVKRAISLLVRASEITTNLQQIFIIAITDFEHYLKLKRERANTTIIYVMIIYLSFGIYLYTAYQLNVPFLASFQNQNVPLDIAGNVTDMFRIGIILGTFSGIMAGQFSSNSILCGFKHSIVHSFLQR